MRLALLRASSAGSPRGCSCERRRSWRRMEPLGATLLHLAVPPDFARLALDRGADHEAHDRTSTRRRFGRTEMVKLLGWAALTRAPRGAVNPFEHGGIDALPERTELARIVEPYGDAAEQTGTTPGIAGTKKGDEVVTLNPDETRGQATRYALEVKDRKLGLSAILAELDEAQSNRGALASVAVFSRDTNCPAAGPFTYHGTRGLAVLDKDEPDPGALRLACLWARWTARRQLAEDREGVDTERIEALIAEGSRALDRLASIRRCHTAARNKVQEAGSQVDDLG